MTNLSPALSRKQTVDFFTRALQAFEASHDAFRVLSTVGPRPGIPDAAATKKLVVLDSSFNPPTTAHAQMALSAMRSAGPSARLLLLLAVNNADKACAPAAFPTRLGMMAAFAREEMASRQVDLGVTTEPFFHDKARGIVESGAYAGRLEQIYLCGFDTVVRIFDAKYYGGKAENMRLALGPFFESARLRVTVRPGDAWGSAEQQQSYLQHLQDGGLERLGGQKAWLGRIEMVDGVDGVVSSSRVRELVRRGGSGIDGLVGAEVRRWMEEGQLYREHVP